MLRPPCGRPSSVPGAPSGAARESEALSGIARLVIREHGPRVPCVRRRWGMRSLPAPDSCLYAPGKRTFPGASCGAVPELSAGMARRSGEKRGLQALLRAAGAARARHTRRRLGALLCGSRSLPGRLLHRLAEQLALTHLSPGSRGTRRAIPTRRRRSRPRACRAVSRPCCRGKFRQG